MCIVEKEWPKIKEESETLAEDVRKLMSAFLDVENEKTRENLVEIFAMLCKIAKLESGQKIIQTISQNKEEATNALQNIKVRDVAYMINFTKYVNQIHSIALKDQALEMMKMMAL